jgi:hypothetical protein
MGLRGIACALALGLSLGSWNTASADPARVYKRTDREGRTVYTNVDDTSENGLRPEIMDLPALIHLDLAEIAPERLPSVDQRIDEVHTATQAGQQCTTIRAASRIPLRTWIWQEHQRELFTAMGLFALSLVVGFAWSGRVMRTLMPVAPFVGALYLGYVAFERSQGTLNELHGGLRACSADLPEARPQDPAVVKQRLTAAVQLQDSVQRVFDGYQASIGAMSNHAMH